MLMIIKKIGFYLIISKFELLFNDLTYDCKISKMYKQQPYCYLRRSLIAKIESFTTEGHTFSHLVEMSFTFITNLNIITYEYYLKQSKSMRE